MFVRVGSLGREPLVPTRAEVLELIAAGDGYEQAAAKLGIPPGQAYLLATGKAADGSDGRSSRQELLHPPAHNPTRKPHVLAWVRERAERELTR
jgi:hypothetical protein